MGFLDKVLRRVEEFILGGVDESRSTEREDIETSEIRSFYFSGLQYERNIGLIIQGEYDISDAQDILQSYAEQNVDNYHEGFFGIAEVEYDPSIPLDEVHEVNL